MYNIELTPMQLYALTACVRLRISEIEKINGKRYNGELLLLHNKLLTSKLNKITNGEN